MTEHDPRCPRALAWDVNAPCTCEYQERLEGKPARPTADDNASRAVRSTVLRLSADCARLERERNAAEDRLAALQQVARAAVALVQFWADEEAGTHPPGLWDVLDEAGRYIAGLKRAVAALDPALKAELEATDV